MSPRFSTNSEVNASELLKNPGEMFTQYWLYSIEKRNAERSSDRIRIELRNSHGNFLILMVTLIVYS